MKENIVILYKCMLLCYRDIYNYINVFFKLQYYINVLFKLQYYIFLYKLLCEKGIKVFVYGVYFRILRVRILRNNGYVILGFIFLKSGNNSYINY